MGPIPCARREAWRRSALGLAAIAAFGAVGNDPRLATPLFVRQSPDRVVDSASIETLVMRAAITLAAAAGVAWPAQPGRWAGQSSSASGCRATSARSWSATTWV